ncbi:MAG: hypothetical protein ACRDHS_15395 [Actinomycetota bacterium]
MQDREIEIGAANRAEPSRATRAVSIDAPLFVLAGALIVLGSIGTWGTIEGSEQSDAILSGTVGGLALAEGKATLALGLVVTVAAAALLLRLAMWRRVLAPVVLLASLAAGTIASVEALRADERFRAARMDQVAGNISDGTGFPFDPIRARLASQVEGPAQGTVGGGMALVLAGAALGAGASALTLAGSRRRSTRAG